MSGNGGTPEQIINVDAGQRAHRPQLMPDGRSVLFTLAQTASWDEAQIVVQQLNGGARKTLIAGGTDGRYVSTGHVVYVLGTTVYAAPYDAKAGTIGSGPVPVLEGVRRSSGIGFFSLSSAASLAYMPPTTAALPRRTLVWVDRSGREEAIQLRRAGTSIHGSPRTALVSPSCFRTRS